MMVKTLIARDFQKDIDIREEAIRDNDLSRIKAIREDLMGATERAGRESTIESNENRKMIRIIRRREKRMDIGLMKIEKRK